MSDQPRFMIAAAHKSSGKTVVSTGLVRALQKQGRRVGSFKKGPDYIDPLWLSTAGKAPCYNLDFNTMDREELTEFFARRASDAEISIVEANKGLFDGIDKQREVVVPDDSQTTCNLWDARELARGCFSLDADFHTDQDNCAQAACFYSRGFFDGVS